MSRLFESFQLGQYALQHRVVLAPMTRMRAGPGDVPTADMAVYYFQRSTAGGLLVTEGAAVSPHGVGYQHTPGIFSQEQADGWRRVTDAVHARGGRVFIQLWHVGRQSHPVVLPDGALPVAPSAIIAEGQSHTDAGAFDHPLPRALELHEIAGIVEQYRTAAKFALQAGFDGVEIHGANGYLPDQFLQDGSNRRTDKYGGSVENRARFMMEVTQACFDVWGPGRVAMRLSPSGQFGSMFDSNRAATFSYVASQLNRFELAYLHIIEPRILGNVTIDEDGAPADSRHLRGVFKGPIISAGGYTRSSAEEILTEGSADLVAFGRLFTSNPDLPARLKNGIELTPYDRATFYGGGARGYIDYPAATRF